MKSKLSVCFFTLALSVASLKIAFAQTDAAQEKINHVGKRYAVLKQMADERVVNYLKNQKSARLFFASHGSTYLLVDVTGSGLPVYEKTDNDDVATSLNVKQLRTGGSLGLNILGTDMRVATWDGGKVRTDHVELIGRVTQQDGATTLDDHATHVMGTILASGVNTAAKGMAPEAKALAYDFNNDVSEMTSLSKPDQTTLLLSNHSYGTVAGWNFDTNWSWHGDVQISNTVDYKFGFYDSKTAAWDDLAFNAPYYTIVKSAGNDRGDAGDGSRPPDGPYDCISTFGIAKNIITVGAVKKLDNVLGYTGPASVEMTDFSSWGPTDDGRIKPDLVAPGQNVLSSTSGSTSEYKSFSGTSMASPAVTGTLTLLQQLYKGLNGGNYMRAASLKAVAIHTAREAGASPGPDYAFGWGLLDAEAAAKIIRDKDNVNIFIKEGTLANGQTFELELNPQQNTKITATLVWTDPAGIPPAPSLNPSNKMLVNDLDLRLTDDAGNSQLPWILDPSSPSTPATKGDNTRDNVEKIEFSNPDPRTYKVVVSHKGTLKNSQPQNFSVVVSYTSNLDTRVTYYWINGSGDWNDGTHWSLSSNGPAANAVPGQDDRVVFDENSFSSAATVNLTQDQSCYSLRWFAGEAVNLTFNNHVLNIYENVLFVANQVTTPTAGTIYFHGTASLHQIGMNSNVLDKLGLFFDGNSTWEVTGDFSADKIRIIQGTVDILNASPKLDSIISSGGLYKKLKLDNAILKPLQTLRIFLTPSGLGTEVESVSSSISVTATTPPYDFNFGTDNIDPTINLQGGTVVITGSGTVAKVEGLGTLQLNGNLKVSDLSLNAGSQLILTEGIQPLFTDKISLAGQNGNTVTVKTTGTNTASLSFDDYYKICFDYLDIQNVNIEGQSIVNAGANSTLTNAANWFHEDCDGILFPDFTFTYNCAEGSTFFKDSSSGTILTYSWDFGDTGAENTSTLKDPLHFFANAGTYQVALQVSNGTKTQKVTKSVTIQANALADNKIELNNGQLISFVPAQSYQWLLDGAVVDGATNRTINFTGKPGEYQVLTFDDNCNKRSSSYIITAVENEPVNASSIQVYPNPASGSLHVSKFSEAFIEKIEMFNALGRGTSLIWNESEDEWVASLAAVSPGIYFLRISTSRGPVISKVIVR